MSYKSACNIEYKIAIFWCNNLRQIVHTDTKSKCICLLPEYCTMFLHFDGIVIRGCMNVARMELAICPTLENINPTSAKKNEGETIKTNGIYSKHL